MFSSEKDNLQIYNTIGKPIVVDTMRGYHGKRLQHTHTQITINKTTEKNFANFG